MSSRMAVACRFRGRTQLLNVNHTNHESVLSCMDSEKWIAIIFVLLMVGSMVAYSATLI